MELKQMKAEFSVLEKEISGKIKENTAKQNGVVEPNTGLGPETEEVPTYAVSR